MPTQDPNDNFMVFRGLVVPRMDGIEVMRLYRVWCGMKNRCHSPRDASFKNYGGRGITVCDRWLASFPAFLTDMGPRPYPRAQIDRLDNDGPYSPENCWWTSRMMNAGNKRNNRFLTANGVTKHLAEWARDLGVHPSMILYRIDKAGWPVERAVTEPATERPNAKLSPEIAKEIRAAYPAKSSPVLAKEYGVNKATILNIIHGRIYRDP